jgi:hypothetical protein
MLDRHVTFFDLAEAFRHCARTICRVLFDMVALLRVATKFPHCPSG